MRRDLRLGALLLVAGGLVPAAPGQPVGPPRPPEPPAELLAKLAGGGHLSFARTAGGGLEATLKVPVPAAPAAGTVPVLAGLEGKASASCPGRGGRLAYTAAGTLQVLLEAGDAATLTVTVETVAKSGAVLVEPGPFRPLGVLAGTGVELVGAAPGGLLGPRGSIGVAWGLEGLAAQTARRELAGRIDPPSTWSLDALYRIQLDACSARLVLRDPRARSDSPVELGLVGGGTALAVSELPGGVPVRFDASGSLLRLFPRPGPGPRAYLVELVGRAPQGPGHEVELPGLAGNGPIRIKYGWLALDDRFPGADGSFGDSAGAPVSDPAGLDPLVRAAWDGSGFTAFPATGKAPRISIAERRNREERNLVGLTVSTHLATPGREATDLGFLLPTGSAPVELLVVPPEGAGRLAVSLRGARVTPVVEPQRPGESLPAVVRLRIEDGASVHLSYVRDLVGESGRPVLSLPRFDREIGSVAWAIQAAPGTRIGTPQVGALVSISAAETATRSAGPMQGDAEGLVQPVAQVESTGAMARVNLGTGIPSAATVQVVLTVVSDEALLLAQVLLFLGGIGIGIWATRGCPPGAEAAPLGIGILMGVAGLTVSGFPRLALPWVKTLIAGATGSLFLRLAAWGVAAEPGPPVVERKGPPKDGSLDRPQRAPQGP